RTDVGIKVFGQNLDTIAAVSERVKAALEGTSGIQDLYVEPVTGGKYLTIDIKRDALARYGLTVDDVNQTIESVIGGATIGQTIEGRRRFSINIRLAQDYRNSLAQLNRVPLQSSSFGNVPLGSVANLRFENGPPMITSDNA